MKRILLFMWLTMAISFSYSQTTYYWVGGANPVSIHTTSNWNSALNGSGSTRPSSTGATDILVFDGTNIGGATPATGLVSGPVDGGITCAQLKFVNNANVQFGRTSGTGTITVSGDGSAAEDFVIESGSTLTISSATGSVRIATAAANTGRVSGNLNMTTAFQARIDNTTSGTPGTLRFTSGSTFTTNITAASASYGFGNSTQSSQRWVVFEAGSHLYFNGGFSPHGSGTLFSAIDMRSGSVWHHRGTQGGGNFFNRQSYGDIIVENNATLTATGSIYRMENLTVNAGCTFIPNTTGQTVVAGNVVVNGVITLPATGTNKLVMAGNSAQSISGTGTINLGGLTIADKANVTLNTNIAVDAAVDVYGKINFNTNQITGNATFSAAGVEPNVAGTANLTNGNYFITGNTSFTSATLGKTISGTGIAPNTQVVSFSTTSDSVYLSQPLTGSGSAVSLSVSNSSATLVTSNTNGFNASTGSAVTAGNKIYGDSINYIINAATTSPFGITTGSSSNMVLVGFAELNAPVTANTGFKIHDYLTLNGKLTLRPLDVLHIAAGSVINGTFSSSNYIATHYNAAGDQSLVRYDGISYATTLPIGTVNYYMPVSITPTTSSDITAAVFEGITTNGSITGTALTATQKQTVVNAVWNINRLNGSGTAIVQLRWNNTLEGSTFTTLPNTDIGLIKNNGSSWDLPIGTGDNTANTVNATISSFGSFGAGAVPQVNPFVFNDLPAKTYGNADFNGGATSLNTTQPIVYTSSNTAVATIVNGNIHIVGAGTTNITASQSTDGFYPAASVTKPLTVNKASLTITADNKLNFEGEPLPTLTATYTGLVLSETPAALLTPAILSTTALSTSPPGTYPITVSGATSNNYSITFANGILTVQAKQAQTITFPAPATKTYGNADFSAGATSTNNTIPLTYTSSNTAVATVNSSGVIHITGGGTTTITVSQAGNAGYFPATSVARTLTVNKVNLTIRVRDTTKVQGEVNPPFTITYTGFVLGETATNLTTPPTVATMATTNSTAGYYALTPQGAASNNYNFIYTDGRLTIYPTTGTTQQYLHAFTPNKDVLTVRVFSVNPTIGDIVLYDMFGRPLIKRNLFMPPGFINADLFISSLPGGIYTVTVRGEGVKLKKTIAIRK